MEMCVLLRECPILGLHPCTFNSQEPFADMTVEGDMNEPNEAQKDGF